MKLVAVTICINYSDYLACVMEANRVHFDRWVVVSVAEDRATHELCARYGVECIDSRLLRADGKDFHAVDNKGPVLNEGIAHAMRDTGCGMRDAQALAVGFSASGSEVEMDEGDSAQSAVKNAVWCVVLDADVLLPRYFGERVRAMPLEAGCLYAMGGRKVCETREQFEMLRECEPWDRLVARNSQAIGYFNLFSLDASPNRYVVRKGMEGSAHDDFLFTTSFAPSKRRVLPFTAIHLGIYGPNWGGRVTGKYEIRNGVLPADYADYNAGKSAQSAQSAGENAAVIGYFPGGRWLEVTRGFSTVYLVDHFCVHPPSGSTMIEAERTVLRRRFDEQAQGAGNLEMLGVHSVENVGQIADGSLDLLYIPGEVAPEWLCRALPHWLPKMREGGTICGELYGLPHWPDATYTIALLLGTPEDVLADGRWRKIYRAESVRIPHVTEGDGQRGVVFVNTGTGNLEALSLGLFGARTYWDGWLVVMHHGEESESLRILCARLGVELQHASMEPVDDWDELLEECAKAPPCPVSLMLLPWHLPVGPLAPAFDEVPAGWQVFRSEPRVVDEEYLEGGPKHPSRGQPVGRRFSFASAQTYTGTPGDGCVVVYADDAGYWGEAAWAARCDVEAEAALASAPRIRFAEEATVVAVVANAEEAGEFQRNWLTWNIAPEIPVVVLLAGMPAEELWLPGGEGRVQVIALSAKQEGDLAWLLSALANTVKTRLVTFISGTAAALPGAELWKLGEAPRIHATELGAKEREVTGNAFLPATLFAQVEREALRELAPQARGLGLSEIASVFHWLAEFAKDDVGTLGWKFPAVHRIAGRALTRTAVTVRSGVGDPPAVSAGATRPKIRRGADGTITGEVPVPLRLADDVVVISLPERLDRRRRIVAMMGEHNLAFRFSDGVRVRDKDILPEEIAEVGRHGFKEVGTFEKYLRGMVGCRRAHLRVLEKAFADGLDSLLIFEDDAHLTEGWLKHYKAALTELPAGWHQLYLSASPFRKSVPFSKTLWRIAAAYQTTAILYSLEGIEVALKCLRKSRAEIDYWYGIHLHPFGNCYSIHPSIAYQEGGVSDIMSFNRGITP